MPGISASLKYFEVIIHSLEMATNSLMRKALVLLGWLYRAEQDITTVSTKVPRGAAVREFERGGDPWAPESQNVKCMQAENR
jgi:hypothetical protein